MLKINVVAVIVAAVASFAGSGVWYAVLGDRVARLQAQWRGSDPAAEPNLVRYVVVFLATALVLALVIAALVEMAGVSGPARSAGFGLMLWVGFALTQWVGSIVGEEVPLELAAIHAGDWLLHSLIITVIVGSWK